MRLKPVVRDAGLTRSVTEEAIARADLVTPEHRAKLDDAIATSAMRLSEFSADDVWEDYGEIPANKKQSSALGQAVRRALRADIMEKKGVYIKSERPETHGNEIPVYISNVCD